MKVILTGSASQLPGPLRSIPATLAAIFMSSVCFSWIFWTSTLTAFLFASATATA